MYLGSVFSYIIEDYQRSVHTTNDVFWTYKIRFKVLRPPVENFGYPEYTMLYEYLPFLNYFSDIFYNI